MEKISFQTSEKIRLDEFLRNVLPERISQECSNSKIRRLIVSGCVFVNHSKITRPSFELRGKSTVGVEFDADRFFYEKQPDDITFHISSNDILFEDENLIFLNKPAFFPVEQTVTGNRNNLHDELIQFLWNRTPEFRNPPYAGIMHRLDKDTSGVILFTKNRSVNKLVSEMFQNHDFEKKYLAVIRKPTEKNIKPGDSFTVEMFMGRLTGKSQQGVWGKLSEENGGQYSKTDFLVLKEISVENKKCYLVQCNLYTGRTHQIRVHLADKGFPILGDRLYGGEEAQRLYLHALSLKKTGELQFDVTAPVPWNE